MSYSSSGTFLYTYNGKTLFCTKINGYIFQENLKQNVTLLM